MVGDKKMLNMMSTDFLGLSTDKDISVYIIKFIKYKSIDDK